MRTVGSYAAKTHLPRLLQKVAKGEEFTITIHGRPVALLTSPHQERSEEDIAQVIADFEAFSRKAGRKVDWATLKAWRDHGRR
jgi:prevent-host-death family protein